MSCLDNEYLLVDSRFLFIDSLDYRYRTINKYMNCNDVNKWSMDIVAIIPSFVESKSRLFSGHSYLVTIVEIAAFLREIVNFDTRDKFCHDRVRMLYDGALKTATSGEKYMRNNACN